jgi:hypothetical protein
VAAYIARSAAIPNAMVEYIGCDGLNVKPRIGELFEIITLNPLKLQRFVPSRGATTKKKWPYVLNYNDENGKKKRVFVDAITSRAAILTAMRTLDISHISRCHRLDKPIKNKRKGDTILNSDF